MLGPWVGIIYSHPNLGSVPLSLWGFEAPYLPILRGSEDLGIQLNPGAQRSGKRKDVLVSCLRGGPARSQEAE